MVGDKELKKGYIAIAAIGVTMLVSVFIYAVLVEIISYYYAPFNGFVDGFEYAGILRYALIGVSAVTLAVIGPMRRAVLSEKYARLMGQKTGNSSARQPFYGQFMSASTIVYALCETPSIYGLTLFLIAGSRIDFYIFMAISLAGFAVFFPRYSQFKSWAVNREGSSGPDADLRRRTEYDSHTGRYRR